MDKFAVAYLVGFFALLFMIFSGAVELKDSIQDMANVLIGVLATGMIKIMDFRYGSSMGSKMKTAALTKLTEEKDV